MKILTFLAVLISSEFNFKIKLGQIFEPIWNENYFLLLAVCMQILNTSLCILNTVLYQYWLILQSVHNYFIFDFYLDIFNLLAHCRKQWRNRKFSIKSAFTCLIRNLIVCTRSALVAADGLARHGYFPESRPTTLSAERPRDLWRMKRMLSNA